MTSVEGHVQQGDDVDRHVKKLWPFLDKAVLYLVYI